MFLSIFDLFKIGIGPSSSHTMGPMAAALRFLHEVRDGDWPKPASANVTRISVSLHGSLAFTGKGHGSDTAIILGLMGCEPSTMDPDVVEGVLKRVRETQKIEVDGFPEWDFDPDSDLIFDYDEKLPGHANAMRFSALDELGNPLMRQIYYSVGGGFVVDALELERMNAGFDEGPKEEVPYPFASACEMLDMARNHGLSVAQMKRKNEETVHGNFPACRKISMPFGAPWMPASNAACRRRVNCPADCRSNAGRARWQKSWKKSGAATNWGRWLLMTGCRSLPWRLMKKMLLAAR